MWPRFGILVLLACVAGPTVPRALAASSSPFYTAGVTLNNVTKLVRAGQRVVLDSGTPGADGAYDLRLQLRNTGMRTVAVQSLQTAVYVGTSVNGSSASGTTTGPLLVVPAQVRGVTGPFDLTLREVLRYLGKSVHCVFGCDGQCVYRCQSLTRWMGCAGA